MAWLKQMVNDMDKMLRRGLPAEKGGKPMNNDGIKFSQTSTFGNHLYRRKGEIAEIIFENERLGIRKVIVDNNGKIQDFPGVMYPEVVSSFSMAFNTPIIRYRSSIKCLDGQYALIWQIQPDGRYW